MWRDGSELTAPAIVISSLGGLVYGKNGLTPQDMDRARVLRHALKAQLGRSRAPPPRVKHCTDQDVAGEILHHRVLSKENGVAHIRNANNLGSRAEERHHEVCKLSSSNVRAHCNTGAPPSSTIDARVPRRCGWKVKGQRAGEWRDCLGRRGRTGPTENENIDAMVVPAASEPPTGAVETSMVSSVLGSSSCAGTKVSFEGLVDELRERLPSASLVGNYGAEQNRSIHSPLPRSDAMANGTGSAIDWQDEKVAGNEGGDAGDGRNNENVRRSLASTAGVARLDRTGDLEQRWEGGAAAGLMPPGCLRLRHPVLATLRAPTSSQPLIRPIPPRNGYTNPRLSSSAGGELNRLIRHPAGSKVISGESTCRLVTTGVSAGAAESNTSPSAEMVATAKAHERALPLLQVCAVRIVEPAGC